MLSAHQEENLDSFEAYINLSHYGVHLKTYPLYYRVCNEWKIGRKEENDIVIPSLAVSRYHATIIRKMDTAKVVYAIIDGCLSSRSKYGIFWKGMRLEYHQLQNGDIITLPDNYALEFGYKEGNECNPLETFS